MEILKKKPEIFGLFLKHLESLPIAELVCKIFEVENSQPGFLKVYSCVGSERFHFFHSGWMKLAFSRN